jgi:hypothetical protein
LPDFKCGMWVLLPLFINTLDFHGINSATEISIGLNAILFTGFHFFYMPLNRKTTIAFFFFFNWGIAFSLLASATESIVLGIIFHICLTSISYSTMKKRNISAKFHIEFFFFQVPYAEIIRRPASCLTQRGLPRANLFLLQTPPCPCDMGVVPPAALAANADLRPPELQLFDRAVACLLAALGVGKNTLQPPGVKKCRI